MSMHLAAYLIFALAMLACGLSTGAQAYYLVALALFALLILSRLRGLGPFHRAGGNEGRKAPGGAGRNLDDHLHRAP